jgi:hypothetical protein
MGGGVSLIFGRRLAARNSLVVISICKTQTRKVIFPTLTSKFFVIEEKKPTIAKVRALKQ